MKRRMLLLLLLLWTTLLSGCGSLYTQRREVEQLRVMETLGLDPAPGGVVLTLASSSGAGEGEAMCCSAAGASVSDALERLQDGTLEAQLFCGHLQHILIGEAAASRGLEGFLAFVCRSSDLRLDMPVYLVLGADAREAMESVGSGEKNIADALTALEEAAERSSRLSTAGTILRDLGRQNCALVRALRLQEAAEEGAEAGMMLVPAGFGVLVDGKLAGRIGPEDALAVRLLTDTLSPAPLVIYDTRGRAVTLELQESRSGLEPVWDEDGALSGLDLTIKVRAAVLEIDSFEDAADEALLEELTARMETELSGRAGSVLRLSRRLEADFLGLGTRLEQKEPLRCRGLDRRFGALLPGLSLTVALEGELVHGNDIT